MIRPVLMLLVVPSVTLIVSVLVFLTAPFDRRNRIFSFWAHFWGAAWLWSAGVRLQVLGAEHVPGLGDPPVALVANHQSILDIPIMVVLARGRLRGIAKSSMRFIPFLGQLMMVFGFTFVDRKNPRRSQGQLRAMVHRLQQGHNSFLMFPEGTRSPSGLLRPFKRGTFKLIKRAGAPVVPFAIVGSGDLLPRGSLWVRPGEVEVHVGRPITADEVEKLSRDELLARTRDFILQFVPEQDPGVGHCETDTTREASAGPRPQTKVPPAAADRSGRGS